MSNTFRISLPWILVCFFGIIALCASFYALGVSRSRALPENVQNVQIKEVQELIQSLGRVIELPSGETPTLATVTDVTKLPGIAFFSHAKQGDKVLMYQNAGKAYLYRPSIKKIIDISTYAPVQQNENKESKQVAYTVALRNGTSVTGVTQEYEKKLSLTDPRLVVVDKAVAKRRDYSDTMIIARNDISSQYVENLAQTLGIAIGQMPALEATSSADIMVIIGKDAISQK